MSNKTPMLLRLNVEALNALFPEGSQARIDLQQSVVQEMTTRFVKQRFSDENIASIEKLCREVQKEMGGVEGIMKRWFEKENRFPYNFTRINETFKKELKDQISQLFANEIGVYVQERIDEERSKMESAIDYRIEQHMKRFEANEVERRIQAKVKEFFQNKS